MTDTYSYAHRTGSGQSFCETFDPPLPQIAVPEIPLARLAREARLGVVKAKPRNPNDRRSRWARLKEKRAKALAE